MSVCNAFVLVFVSLTSAAIAQYRRGDGVLVECAFDAPQVAESAALLWKPFPLCFETDLPLELRFGKDQAMYCGLEIDAALFSWMQAAVSVQDCLQCRVAVAPNQQLYLPMCWPVWGAKDAEHLHINNRFDVVLYADRGLVVGGGVYPVKGHFQYVKEGQVLNLHGVVRWLDVDLNLGTSSSNLKDFVVSPIPAPDTLSRGTGLVVLLCVVCALLVIGLLYYFTAYRQAIQKKAE